MPTPAATAYDGLDRRISESDAVGNSVAYTYDDNSNLLTVTETDVSPEGTVPAESFSTTFAYDSLDRRTSVTDNLGNLTSYAYDSRNNRIGTTDALGNTTGEIYDGLNRRLATIRDLRVGGIGSGALDSSNANNPDGQITRAAAWDGNSRLVSETDDNGNTSPTTATTPSTVALPRPLPIPPSRFTSTTAMTTSPATPIKMAAFVSRPTTA